MCHTAFKVIPTEQSPWYSEDKMAKFALVRGVTTYDRPPGGHGCKLVEIVPGLWTAHFHDFNTRELFEQLPVSPPIKLVVNSGVAYNQCPTYEGFYGPDVHVLPISLYDDPKEGEAHVHAGDAKQYFRFVNEMTKKTIEGGGSVLIHCMASLSRSVAFILAYLMETQKLSLVEATSFMKKKWDAVWPNDSFVFQLIDFEKELQL
jgi:protein-tyrosine phosphatase